MHLPNHRDFLFLKNIMIQHQMDCAFTKAATVSLSTSQATGGFPRHHLGPQKDGIPTRRRFLFVEKIYGELRSSSCCVHSAQMQSKLSTLGIGWIDLYTLWLFYTAMEAKVHL